MEELTRPLLECANGCVLVLLGTPLLVLELNVALLIRYLIVSLIELLLEASQFNLVFTHQRALINILVDSRLILDFLGARSELER